MILRILAVYMGTSTVLYGTCSTSLVVRNVELLGGSHRYVTEVMNSYCSTFPTLRWYTGTHCKTEVPGRGVSPKRARAQTGVRVHEARWGWGVFVDAEFNLMVLNRIPLVRSDVSTFHNSPHDETPENIRCLRSRHLTCAGVRKCRICENLTGRKRHTT